MLKEKIKNFVTKKTEGNKKKSIENLVVFLILLIITVIAINMIWNKDEAENGEKEQGSYKTLANKNENVSSNIVEKSEYNLQTELEDILSKMDGIGKVKVLITYSQTSTVVPMYSQTESSTLTEETDSSGGTRKQESSNVNKEVITDGDSKAVTQTVILPKVEGAIVIAEGGGNATTKGNIIQAVSAVTGLATYKVQVFEMQKN